VARRRACARERLPLGQDRLAVGEDELCESHASALVKLIAPTADPSGPNEADVSSTLANAVTAGACHGTAKIPDVHARRERSCGPYGPRRHRIASSSIGS
jgi:hypothetical protein